MFDSITLENSESKDGEVLSKSPKPMDSKSEVFEAAYSDFMLDVFSRDIKSVSIEETADARSIILAGCEKFSVVKRTGLFKFEVLSNIFPVAEEQKWVRKNLDTEVNFWLSPSRLASLIESAWVRRLKAFIPDYERCYSDKAAFSKVFGYEESGFGRGDYREHIWRFYIYLAAKRRTRKKGVMTAATRTLIHALWNVLSDRETINLAIKYFGRRASFLDYNFVVRQRQYLLAREVETPNLIPIIGKYLKYHKKWRSGLKKLPSDILRSIKQKYTDDGLLPVGWRYIASGTKRATENYLIHLSYGNEDEDQMSVVEMINILAATGIKFPESFVDWVLNCRKLIKNINIDSQMMLIRFFKIAGIESIERKRKGSLKRFLKSELILVWDWFLDNDMECGPVYISEGSFLRLIAKNATWNSIMRAQLAWHADAAERGRLRREADEAAYQKFIEERSAICWKSEIDVIDFNGVKAIPLTTGKELLLEAVEMDHCVDRYIDLCKQGESRIFHLKGIDGDATMEIARSTGNKWVVRQVFGLHNDHASSDMHKVAKAIAERYTVAMRAR